MPAPDNHHTLYLKLERLTRELAQIERELAEPPKPQTPVPAAVRAAKRWGLAAVAGLIAAAMWVTSRTARQYITTAGLAGALGTVAAVLVLLIPDLDSDAVQSRQDETAPTGPATTTEEPTTELPAETTATTTTARAPTSTPATQRTEEPPVVEPVPEPQPAVVDDQPDSQPPSQPASKPDGDGGAQPEGQPPGRDDQDGTPDDHQPPASEPPDEPPIQVYCADVLPLPPEVNPSKCLTDVTGLVEETS